LRGARLAVLVGILVLVTVIGDSGVEMRHRSHIRVPAPVGGLNRQDLPFVPTRRVRAEPDTDELDTTTVTITAVGDCVLGTDYRFTYANSLAGQFDREDGDMAYFLGGVRELLGNDDLTIANLETTLTTTTARIPKAPPDRSFWFRGDPSYVGILTAGSVEAVDVANNHSYDYQEAGFLETLATLEEAGIGYFGHGYVHYATVRGIRVALLGFNQLGNRATGPGLAQLTKLVVSAVEEHRSTHDLVIVSFHWGKEYEFLPTPDQITLGHRTIDAGADLVIGHHPHVVQGIETYGGKHIVYSLGNFVYGGSAMVKDGGHTMIFQEVFEFLDGVLVAQEHRVIPASYSTTDNRNDYRPKVLTGPERATAEEKLQTRTILLDQVVHGRPRADVDYLAAIREKMRSGSHTFEVPDIVTGLEAEHAPDSALVDLRDLAPGVIYDPPYATTANILGKKLYYHEFPYLRAGTARMLRAAQQLAEAKGYRLKVWDAYRPPEVQWMLWERFPEARCVASPPGDYSAHNRGAAVEVTLVDPAGQEPDTNTRLLQAIMERAGFSSVHNEWWYFYDPNGTQYGIIDIYPALVPVPFAGPP